MLRKEHGQDETALMQDFLKLPNPYEPGYRHDTALNAARRGMIGAKELRDTAPSTDGSVAAEIKKPGESGPAASSAACSARSGGLQRLR